MWQRGEICQHHYSVSQKGTDVEIARLQGVPSQKDVDKQMGYGSSNVNVFGWFTVIKEILNVFHITILVSL